MRCQNRGPTHPARDEPSGLTRPVITRRPMQDARVEDDAVARFHIPADDVESRAVRFDIGYRYELHGRRFGHSGCCVIIEVVAFDLPQRLPAGTVVEEARRHEVTPPEMRAANEFERAASRHRIESDPDRAERTEDDGVVMPGRTLLRAGKLDEPGVL